jgi:hypothetical protein
MSTYQVETTGGTYQVETDDAPETSVQGAVGRGALDAIPFGTKGAAALQAGIGEGKYEDYLKELDQLLATDKQQHPIAHATGEVAGSVAPFMVPGVGEALGAETLAGRAGIGAGIGALQGASNTREDLTSPEGMKDIAMSAGTGAVLNPAIGKIGDMLASGASHLAPKLEEIANSKAVQAGNLRPGTLGIPKEELQELGNTMRQLDVVQGSTSDRYAHAQDLLHQVGAQIGDIGAGSAPLKDPMPFAQNLIDEAEKSSKFFGPEGNADLNMYRQGAANLVHNGKTFDELQALKSAYGEKAFDANGEVSNPAAAKVYRQIKDAMKSVVGESPAEYQDLMKSYGQLKDITSGLKNQLQREQSTGTQVKGFGMAGKLGGMLTGGNVPLTIGGAVALAPAHPFMALGLGSTLATNPQLMSKAAGMGAEALTGMAEKGLPTAALTNVAEHGGMGHEMAQHAALHQAHSAVENIPPSYAPVFQKATQGLNDPAERAKQMTITDFVLQSRDPNYSKAKQKMQEDSNAF